MRAAAWPWTAAFFLRAGPVHAHWNGWRGGAASVPAGVTGGEGGVSRARRSLPMRGPAWGPHGHPRRSRAPSLLAAASGHGAPCVLGRRRRLLSPIDAPARGDCAQGLWRRPEQGPTCEDSTGPMTTRRDTGRPPPPRSPATRRPPRACTRARTHTSLAAGAALAWVHVHVREQQEGLARETWLGAGEGEPCAVSRPSRRTGADRTLPGCRR